MTTAVGLAKLWGRFHLNRVSRGADQHESLASSKSHTNDGMHGSRCVDHQAVALNCQVHRSKLASCNIALGRWKVSRGMFGDVWHHPKPQS